MTGLRSVYKQAHGLYLGGTQVGKMELFSEKFSRAVLALMQHCGQDCNGSVILGTIPQTRSPIPLVEQIRKSANVEAVTITKANRDAETERIYKHLLPYYQGLLFYDQDGYVHIILMR